MIGVLTLIYIVVATILWLVTCISPKRGVSGYYLAGGVIAVFWPIMLPIGVILVVVGVIRRPSAPLGPK